MSILSIVKLYTVYKEIFSFIINATIFDSLYISVVHKGARGPKWVFVGLFKIIFL